MDGANSRLSKAFLNAKQDFLSSLKDPALVKEVSNITSVTDIYNFVIEFQKRNGIKNLSRIHQYLDRLKQYASVIEVFIQVKPDVLALIWGPIKLLLQLADNLIRPLIAILDTMAAIGDKLPIFESYSQLFRESDRVVDALALFYRDILDFYGLAVNLFSAKRWQLVFESVWPRQRDKINAIIGNIEHHCLLLREEINLEHITHAYKARITQLEKCQQDLEFQERQEFGQIESYISPELYDNDLDKLLTSASNRTGRWLQKEQAFTEWSNFGNTLARVIWLQGIPGAGKTYLASLIVDSLRQSSNTTLFAFLSYKKANLQSISIMHSLLFQLVIGEKAFDEVLKKDLRAMLFDKFQSDQRNLKSNTKFARQTLTELLKCAGPTYIVIDGLDEIPESERRIALNELLELLRDTAETKLFVSSRAEDDISKILKRFKPSIIRVDDKNRGCIQAYVSEKTRAWLEESDFDEKICSEITGLLSSLPSKSKGMFLYARVVMENIQMCFGLEQIKKELRALPENLDDAYSRIIQRLDSLPPSLTELSRRVLGWIGCSPTPLKIQELSCALSVNSSFDRQTSHAEGLLNVVRLCGPIVEISGDYVHLVHFTVKEYLICRQADNFVQTVKANLDMAKTSLYYLCLDIFDPEIEPHQIKENILSGAYRLYWFASTQWVEIIRNYAISLDDRSEPDDGLISALSLLLQRRENTGFQDSSDCYSTRPCDELEIFNSKSLRAYKLFQQTLRFWHLDTGSWKLDDEDDSWTTLDPLTLSNTAINMFKEFQSLLCPEKGHSVNCHCHRLQAKYGKKLFRCKYTICQPQQTAFNSKSQFDAHCKKHDRPYKCSHSECEFSSIGFASKSQLTKHLDKCHLDTPPRPIHLAQDPDLDEYVPLVSDLIELGRENEIKALSGHFKDVDIAVQKQLIKEAAVSSSLAIVTTLLDAAATSLKRTRIHHEIAFESIKGENLDVLNWAGPRVFIEVHLEDGSSRKLQEIMQLGVNSDSTEIFHMWKKHFLHNRPKQFAYVAHWDMISSVKDPLKQERLAKLWKEREFRASLAGHAEESQLGSTFRKVVSRTYSVVMAKGLLELGVDVDFKEPGSGQKTALHECATKTSKKAAKMTQFLLLSGADPNAVVETRPGPTGPNIYIRTPASEPGAQMIKTHLGMTWDELVNWAKEQRQLGVPK